MTQTAPTDRPLPATYEPRHETYGPGIGLTIGLVGVGLIAVSLFGMNWLNVGNGAFLQLSGQARRLGVHELGIPVFSYLAWAGFLLMAVTAAFMLLAGIPLPRTAAGNSYPRVAGALIAACGAAVQTYVIVRGFPARLVAPGAWLGVAGYLVVIAGFVIGARRRVY